MSTVRLIKKFMAGGDPPVMYSCSINEVGYQSTQRFVLNLNKQIPTEMEVMVTLHDPTPFQILHLVFLAPLAGRDDLAVTLAKTIMELKRAEEWK